MDSFNAVMTLEEGTDDELEAAKAMQSLINSGTVWSLQGSYGRAAMDALESGRNMLGKRAHRDYWGNRIPSRDEVKAGTKGSRQLVVEQFGEEYAAMLDAVE